MLVLFVQVLLCFLTLCAPHGAMSCLFDCSLFMRVYPVLLFVALRQEHVQVMTITIPEGWSRPRAFYEANKIDFHLCGIMFWFMGGRVSAKILLRTTVVRLIATDNTSCACAL